MRYISWAITILFFGAIATVLYYTLPRHDVVRIVDTEVRRVDFGANSLFWSNAGGGNAGNQVSRDVFFISAARHGSGRTIVYRNEDTGWIWPPYFKLNAANLQARATDLISSSAEPRWVIVRKYGWRFEPLSIYPNAIRVWETTTPDARIVNWFNIIFLFLFVSVGWAIRRRWIRFRERRIDPVITAVDDRVDETGSAIARGWRRLWN